MMLFYILQLIVIAFAAGFVGYTLGMAPKPWKYIGLVAYIIVVLNLIFKVPT